MEYINMSIIYWFYNCSIILEIKVDLIGYKLSKAVQNNELMVW